MRRLRDIAIGKTINGETDVRGVQRDDARSCLLQRIQKDAVLLLF